MTKSPSRFADGAGRLDRFVEEIKARQHEATGVEPRPVPVPPLPPARHPDETWLRNYGVRSIRLRRPGESVSALPDYVLTATDQPRNSGQPRQPVADKINSGPIGAVIGKPVDKRGFWGRLRGGPR
jgi:hypothetical protein